MKSVPPPPPDIKGRNKTDLQKRQRIIQSLAVGGLAVTAWQKPIINSVLLPAHAQQSADPANPSGQAGQSGQTGQTNQGQTNQGQTNQEQTAVPQQNQQQQQGKTAAPNHDRLELLPRRPNASVKIIQIRNAEQCKTIQIARIELANRYHGPGIPDDEDYWIKVTGIQTPVVTGTRNTRRAPLNLVLLIAEPFTAINSSIDALPARDSGMFTAFFRNLSSENQPLTQAYINRLWYQSQILLRCLGTR